MTGAERPPPEPLSGKSRGIPGCALSASGVFLVFSGISSGQSLQYRGCGRLTARNVCMRSVDGYWWMDKSCRVARLIQDKSSETSALF